VKIFPAGPVGVRFDLRQRGGYTLPGVKFNIPASITTQTVQTENQTLELFSRPASALSLSFEGERLGCFR